MQWAIQGINFEVSKHGIYGLLGSNGAGKSTTMNIICGVLKQTRGSVLIKGIDVRENPVSAKRCIGFLHKSPLYMDLSVYEYLMHATRMSVPSSERKKAVKEVMERCGIAHFENRLIRNLSGGYQQRVGIAQAIVHKPEFVVLDEPTNGLDPNQILEVRRLIQDISKECTVILSTHILSEVQAVCDHVYMIEQGTMVFSGSLEEFDNYIIPDSFVVSLASPPVTEDLKVIQGVKEVEELGGMNFRVHFTGEDANPVMELMVNTSRQRGWNLKEIRLEKSSLDVIFAELSKK
ncbi:MAG: ABC transporter ATP-binding protein [Butyricimonas paravirosa]